MDVSDEYEFEYNEMDDVFCAYKVFYDRWGRKWTELVATGLDAFELRDAYRNRGD